jgi:hypothetical protein
VKPPPVRIRAALIRFSVVGMSEFFELITIKPIGPLNDQDPELTFRMA